MPSQAQSYANHRRYLPLLHFVTQPILLVNVFVEAARLYKYQTLYHVWMVIVAIAIFVFTFVARWMSLTVQNRTIRLEERLRLASLMPEDQRARVNDLTPGQLVGLRYASDGEAVELAQRCLAGDLKRSEDVKRAVRNWRPDHLRV